MRKPKEDIYCDICKKQITGDYRVLYQEQKTASASWWANKGDFCLTCEIPQGFLLRALDADFRPQMVL